MRLFCEDLLWFCQEPWAEFWPQPSRKKKIQEKYRTVVPSKITALYLKQTTCPQRLLTQYCLEMQLYPCHYMPLPFCLQNILSLYSFVQQGAAKETEMFLKTLTTSAWKRKCKGQEIRISWPPCPWNLSWKTKPEMFINISPPPKQAEFFFFHNEVHTSLSST